MKKSFFALALMATVAACGAPAEEAAPEAAPEAPAATEAAAEARLLAMIRELSGPLPRFIPGSAN